MYKICHTCNVMWKYPISTSDKVTAMANNQCHLLPIFTREGILNFSIVVIGNENNFFFKLRHPWILPILSRLRAHILDPPRPERKEARIYLKAFPSAPSSPKDTYVRKVQVELEFHIQPLASIIVRSCKRMKWGPTFLTSCLRRVERSKEITSSQYLTFPGSQS